MTTLRAKGLSEFAVIRHVLKNALPQVLAVMGLQFGYLMGGSILVETVFTWPGSGFLLSKAIINRDIPVLQGTILALSMVFVATNLLVDLLQSMIDPRIRRSLSTHVPRPRSCDRSPAEADDARRARAARCAATGPASATGCATIPVTMFFGARRAADRAGGDLRAAGWRRSIPTRKASSAG